VAPIAFSCLVFLTWGAHIFVCPDNVPACQEKNTTTFFAPPPHPHPIHMVSVVPSSTRGHFWVTCADPAFDIVYWNLLCESLRGQPHVRCAAVKNKQGSGDRVRQSFIEVQAPDLPGGMDALRVLIKHCLALRVCEFTALLHAAEGLLDDDDL
jgi:hypothetical protein